MLKTLFVLFVVALTGADACYAAPGVYTGWCDMNRAVVGHSRYYINYCFRRFSVKMSVNCEVMAKNYVGEGLGRWGAYDIGTINEGTCMRMYWGDVAAVPSVRCFSYGLPIVFEAYTK